MLGYGLRLRCPRCGAGRLFAKPFRMHDNCAHCGLKFEREQGYFVGAIYINYGATTLLGLFLALVVFRGLSTSALLAGAAGWCLLFPTWFFRYSRSLWLGLNTYRALCEGGPTPPGSHPSDN